MWKPLFATLATLVLTSVAAQDSYLISEPEITTCNGSLQDTGGEAGGGYQNNEDFITVICPDTPGQGGVVELRATPFDLSWACSRDRLSIWDGPDDTHPLLGSWTGENSPGIVSASYANVQNTGGCLTVRFTSNPVGIGRFAAFIVAWALRPIRQASIVGATPSPCQTNDHLRCSASTGGGVASQVRTWMDGEPPDAGHACLCGAGSTPFS